MGTLVDFLVRVFTTYKQVNRVFVKILILFQFQKFIYTYFLHFCDELLGKHQDNTGKNASRQIYIDETSMTKLVSFYSRSNPSLSFTMTDYASISAIITLSPVTYWIFLTTNKSFTYIYFCYPMREQIITTIYPKTCTGNTIM